jgi:hypothetical protein
MAPDAPAPRPVVRRRALALGLMLLSVASAPAHAMSPVQTIRAVEIAAMPVSLHDSTAPGSPLIATLLTADTAALQIQLGSAEPRSLSPLALDLSFESFSQ